MSKKKGVEENLTEEQLQSKQEEEKITLTQEQKEILERYEKLDFKSVPDDWKEQLTGVSKLTEEKQDLQKKLSSTIKLEKDVEDLKNKLNLVRQSLQQLQKLV